MWTCSRLTAPASTPIAVQTNCWIGRHVSLTASRGVILPRRTSRTFLARAASKKKPARQEQNLLQGEEEGDIEVEKVLEKYESSQPVADSSPETAKQAEEEDEDNTPKTCSAAIKAGLGLYEASQYEQALAMFNKALELPGNAAIRMAGRVREVACPSPGEENAALYNMACCYAQLGQAKGGMICLEGMLENGFEDFQQLKNDPDLGPLRGPEFNQLLGKYDSLGATVSKIFKKKESGTNKPWLTW